MTDPTLELSARGLQAGECRYHGEDVHFAVEIKNLQVVDVGFPLAFVRQTGPVVRLIDARTGADTYLRKNPAPHALRDQLTPIAPGQSISFEWVVAPSEIEQFGSERVDVTAEITVLANVTVGGARSEFRGTTRLRITGAARR